MKFGKFAQLLGCGILLSCVGLGIAFRNSSRGAPQLNLILITLDTTRADHLGCYGYESALTPTLDKLAEKGVLFERAYTPVPLTLPAHASMLTGLLPFEHGLFTNGGGKLNAGVPHLAETLTARGYTTGAFVASFVLDHQFGLNRGFHVYDDNVDGPATLEPARGRKRSADQVLNASLHWLSSLRGRPFFCWIHLFDPHAEYLEHRESFGDRFRDHPYDAEIAFVDAQLKRLMEFLDAQELSSRTMIVLTADHGEGLGEHAEKWHGYMLYDSTLHVPLIVSLPSKFAAGTRVSTPVSLVDLFPTVLDSLGMPNAAKITGRSLKPALLGEAIAPGTCYAAADEAFLEEGWSPLRSLTTTDWKYIHTTRPELYDLRNDPHEIRNLADENPDRIREFRQQLSDIESQGVRYDGQTIYLSERERNVLKSLGYSGGRNALPPEKPAEELPDIKDMARHLHDFQEAQELAEKGETAAAAARLQVVILEAPRYIAPRLMLGQVLESQGKIEEAKRECENVLSIDPDNARANAHLGSLLAKEGRFEQALPLFTKALERDPDSNELHFSTAMVLKQLGRHEEAVRHIRAAQR